MWNTEAMQYSRILKKKGKKDQAKQILNMD